MIIHFHVQEEHLDHFQALSQENLRDRRSAKGNLLVLFFQQKEHPTHFILIEGFDCQENIDLYYQQKSYQDWYALISPMLQSVEGADYDLRF
ncbi:MAG: antibiotic biosynthesis monooxygenase [Bacteroidota bacterium]